MKIVISTEVVHHAEYKNRVMMMMIQKPALMHVAAEKDRLSKCYIKPLEYL